MAEYYNDSVKKAQMKYDAKATTQVKMKLNLKYDADILEKLNSVENKQGYIKELIRRDISITNTLTTEPTIDKYIVSGKFEPGEKVTVSIDGKEFTRVVRYSTLLKKPAITALNTHYTKSDFE